MKKIIPLFICLLLLSPLWGEELRTSRDFTPAPPEERSMLDSIPPGFNPWIGFSVSAAVTLSGAGLSAYSIHQTLESLIEDPESTAVQTGILQTGACLAGTALFAVISDFFLDRISENRKTEKGTGSLQ